MWSFVGVIAILLALAIVALPNWPGSEGGSFVPSAFLAGTALIVLALLIVDRLA